MIFDINYINDSDYFYKNIKGVYKSIVKFAINNNESGILLGSYTGNNGIKLFDIPEFYIDSNRDIIFDEVTLPKGKVVQGNIPVHFIKDFRKYNYGIRIFIYKSYIKHW